MPLDLLAVSALVCERYLLEKDDVFSLVRVIDLFYVPQAPSPAETEPVAHAIQINILVFVKARAPGSAPFRLLLRRPDGEERAIGSDQVRDVLEIASKFPDTDIPTGTSIALTLHVETKALGTYFLAVEIDGEVRATVPFTLLPSPAKAN